ncbi:Hsp20 family protein [Candidatus Fermentibacteria bacterium]|nr:Hsp20 family protein [Candidatus Fermentibacteria bacterium]
MKAKRAADAEKPAWMGRSRIPAVDISRYRDGRFVLRCELPGVRQDDLTVLMKDNELTIKAHRSWSEEGLALLREIPREGFERRFVLGSELNADNISARFSQGILTLEIPRGKGEKRGISIGNTN